MNDIEQQVGYLVARIEDQGKDIKGLVDRVSALEKILAEKLTTVETVLKIVKFTALAIVALLTFKFGDVSRLWYHFFG